ncbi:MAG: NAD+ synthase [Aggregatilineales bacterium]|nr:NAD+ synthase [Aggregatilineales bacterium]HPV07335.1 NAD+ synthase [Aggregatilineales bacterium]
MTTDVLSQLKLNTDLARRVITLFIRKEITRVGFKRAVLGLSGGLDSALVAYLTAEALGPENVLAIRMPYRTSSPESLEHAQLVIDALGVRHDTVDITPMVEPLFERFPDMDASRRGNVMARQRMIILFDQSAAWNALVVGTSNKTETLLGYTTIYGDNAAAIQPIADLYKAQVRQLARAVGVPEAIVNKAPSADLWPGQTDEGELGYTYDQADQVLYLLVDRHYTLDDAVEAGFPRDLVERVWRTVQRNQFKRELPVVAKLSRRTIGHDFLYLRDWGT